MRKATIDCVTMLADLNHPGLPIADRERFLYAIHCVGLQDPMPVEKREYMGIPFAPTCPRCQKQLTTTKPRFCPECGGALDWKKW